MAKPTELPNLIVEFVDMAKQYLRQETVEPARQLGRFAGFSIAAGVAFAIGVLFLAIAGLRLLLDVLPERPYFEGLGYVLAAVGLAVVAGVVVWIGSRSGEKGDRS